MIVNYLMALNMLNESWDVTENGGGPGSDDAATC